MVVIPKKQSGIFDKSHDDLGMPPDHNLPPLEDEHPRPEKQSTKKPLDEPKQKKETTKPTDKSKPEKIVKQEEKPKSELVPKKFELQVSDGVITRLEHAYNLKESEKFLYHVKGNYRITSEGYIKLNKTAGISMLTPASVIVDGKEVGNPYIKRADGLLVEATVRKIAFGRGPTGKLIAHDQIVSFSPESYKVQLLYSLVENYPKIAEIRTEKSLTDDEKINCEFTKTTGGVGILVKEVGHHEYLKLLKTHSANQAFGDRKAQTICERNCYRKHPAIGATSVQIKGQGASAYAEVLTVGWKLTPGTEKEMQRISYLLESGKEMKGYDVDIKKSVEQAEEIEAAEVVPIEEQE